MWWRDPPTPVWIRQRGADGDVRVPGLLHGWRLHRRKGRRRWEGSVVFLDRPGHRFWMWADDVQPRADGDPLVRLVPVEPPRPVWLLTPVEPMDSPRPVRAVLHEWRGRWESGRWSWSGRVTLAPGVVVRPWDDSRAWFGRARLSPRDE